MEKKINIPNGMRKAFGDNLGGVGQGEGTPFEALEVALLWLAENPSQPDEDQMDELVARHSWLDKDSVRFGAREWQRRMFLAPELVVSAAIRELRRQRTEAGR